MTAALVFGALCGLGALLVIAGFRGVQPAATTQFSGVSNVSGSTSESFVAPLHDWLGQRFDQLSVRAGLAAGVATAMFWLTRWPVGIVLGAVAGFASPSLIGAKKRRDDAVAKTEAIARWTEQLRDTIQSAAGLQEAIVTTSAVAPVAIRAEVKDLAAAIRHRGIAASLETFAQRLDDPVADQVVVALTLAATRGGEKLSTMLDELASSARDEATMRMRVETTRAQTYSDARAVTFIVLGVFALLLIINRAYLDPYNSLGGQIVLCVVGSMWFGALYTIVDLAKVSPGTRLLGHEEQAQSLRSPA